MVLPTYASVEHYDFSLSEAAADLYADRWTTLRHVVFPVVTPGIVPAASSCSSPSLGAFLAPDLLGGGEELHDRVADRGAVPGQRRQLALRRRRVDDPALDGARRAPVLRPPADPPCKETRSFPVPGPWRNVRVWSRWTRSRWRRKLMPSSTSSTGMWGFTCARTPWRTIPPMATRFELHGIGRDDAAGGPHLSRRAAPETQTPARPPSGTETSVRGRCRAGRPRACRRSPRSRGSVPPGSVRAPPRAPRRRPRRCPPGGWGSRARRASRRTRGLRPRGPRPRRQQPSTRRTGVPSPAANAPDSPEHAHDRTRIDDVDTGLGPWSGRPAGRTAHGTPLGVHGAGQIPDIVADRVPDVVAGNGPRGGGRVHRPLDLTDQQPPTIDRARHDVQFRHVAPTSIFARAPTGRAPASVVSKRCSTGTAIRHCSSQAKDSRLGRCRRQ